MDFTPRGKSRLLLSEYGRNVQRMVEYLKTIEDRDLRNRQAQVVVGIMGNLYPYKRDTEAFRNMLWDHLFMIANFEIDIDSPYPRPTPEVFSPVARRVPYSQKRIAQKHYGANIQLIVDAIARDAEALDADKELVMAQLAKYMRQSAYNYNNEYPSNDVVLADLSKMSGGVLTADLHILSSSNVEVRPVPVRGGGKNTKHSAGGRDGGRDGRRGNERADRGNGRNDRGNMSSDRNERNGERSDRGERNGERHAAGNPGAAGTSGPRYKKNGNNRNFNPKKGV